MSASGPAPRGGRGSSDQDLEAIEGPGLRSEEEPMSVTRRSTSLTTPEYSWSTCSPEVPSGGGCSGSSMRSYSDNLDTSGPSPLQPRGRRCCFGWLAAQSGSQEAGHLGRRRDCSFVRAAVCVLSRRGARLCHRRPVAGLDPDASSWAEASARQGRRELALPVGSEGPV
jgi:hypothetical protein